MQFKHYFTRTHKPTPERRTPGLKSKTVPGQTLGLRELLNRYSAGGAITFNNAQFDDGEFPDVSRMDAIDKIELSRKLQNSIAAAQDRMQKAKAAQDQKGLEDAIAKRLEESKVDKSTD